MVNADVKSKASEAASVATDAGWKAKVTQDGTLITLVAKRGDEMITIHWQDTRFVDDAVYECGAYRLKIRNVAAAKKMFATSASEAMAAINKVKASPVRRSRAAAIDEEDSEEAEVIRRQAMPFDVDTTPDEDVFAALRGKNVYWKHSHSTGLRSARVRPEVAQNHFKIEFKGTRRLLTFVAAEGHFVSLYLDKILAVK